MLDINPEYMRRGLRHWKARKIESIERAAIARAEAALIAAENPVVEAPAPVEIEKIATPLAASKPAAAAPQVNKIFNGRGNRAKPVTPVQSGRRATRSLRKLHA